MVVGQYHSNMANLTETSTWETGIYQLETTDPVEAGSGGIANEQARLLGNRTKWLKDNSLLFLKKGTVNIGDVIGSTYVVVTFASLGTSNYMVTGSIVSQGANFTLDNTVIWAIRDRTATSFILCLAETGDHDQNISFDYAIIPK